MQEFDDGPESWKFHSNLNFLKNLQHIEKIDLAGCGLNICPAIDTLDYFGSFAKLRHLDIRDTSISDLTPLRYSVELKYLNIECTKVQSLDALSELRNLEHLDMCSCNGIKDVRPLQGLVSLKVLHMRFCRNISSHSPLGSLSSLQKLSFRINDPQGDSLADRFGFLLHLKLDCFVLEVHGFPHHYERSWFLEHVNPRMSGRFSIFVGSDSDSEWKVAKKFMSNQSKILWIFRNYSFEYRICCQLLWGTSNLLDLCVCAVFS